MVKIEMSKIAKNTIADDKAEEGAETAPTPGSDVESPLRRNRRFAVKSAFWTFFPASSEG